jgi:hypothetical protein
MRMPNKAQFKTPRRQIRKLCWSLTPTILFRLHYDAVFIVSRLVGRAEFLHLSPLSTHVSFNVHESLPSPICTPYPP